LNFPFHSKRIQQHIGKRKSFIKESMEITNSKIHKHEKVLNCMQTSPCATPWGKKMIADVTIGKFLCAIGILTDGNKGYRLFLNEGC